MITNVQPIGKSYKSCVCMSVLKLEKWRLKHFILPQEEEYSKIRECYKLKNVLNL